MPDTDRRDVPGRPPVTASREDLCRRLEAGARRIDEVGTRRLHEDRLDAVLTELAAALRSEAGLALGRPSLVNLHLVRIADALTGRPPWAPTGVPG